MTDPTTRARVRRWVRLAAGALILGGLGLPFAAHAIDPLPHVFTSGDLVKAAEINADFEHLRDGIAALEQAAAAPAPVALYAAPQPVDDAQPDNLGVRWTETTRASDAVTSAWPDDPDGYHLVLERSGIYRIQATLTLSDTVTDRNYRLRLFHRRADGSSAQPVLHIGQEPGNDASSVMVSGEATIAAQAGDRVHFRVNEPASAFEDGFGFFGADDELATWARLSISYLGP